MEPARCSGLGGKGKTMISGFLSRPSSLLCSREKGAEVELGGLRSQEPYQLKLISSAQSFLVSPTLSRRETVIRALLCVSCFSVILLVVFTFWVLPLRMENQVVESAVANSSVKVTCRLGSEVSSLTSTEGCLSEQLLSIKEESMAILKDYITTHNVPTDVPDEPLEGTSEDESDEVTRQAGRSKKRK